MISVVIPTYNRAQYLKIALSSLQSQAIGLDSFEVIIIDDGSRDGTKKISEGFSQSLAIKYFHTSHLGVSKARNLGIEKSTSQTIVFFDDDAIADSRWLENIALIMKEEDIITGQIKPIKNNLWQYFAPHYYQGDKPVESSVLLEGNCAINTRVFDKIGRFDEKLTYGHEGQEFIDRAKGIYKIMYYPQMLIKHDYAFGLINYLTKQFRFGHKMIYLHVSEIKDWSQFLASYYNLKNGPKTAETISAKKPNWLNKILIAMVARLGNISHFIGSLLGYMKYKNNK